MVLLISSIIGALVFCGVIASLWAIGDADYYYQLAKTRTSNPHHALVIGTYGRLRREYALLVVTVLIFLMLAVRLYADPFDLQERQEWFRVVVFTALALVIDLILYWEYRDQRSMDQWFWTHDLKSADKHEVDQT